MGGKGKKGWVISHSPPPTNLSINASHYTGLKSCIKIATIKLQ